MMNKQIFTTVFIIAIILGVVGLVYAATPEGAILTEQKSETTNSTDAEPGNHTAIAGNVTLIDLSGFGVTQTWQGYYGNVSGTLELGDASGNIMYNWSGADATSGEVYAINQSTVSWATIECFDVADGAASNISDLETFYNIANTDADGIDETFALDDHAAFDTAATSFTGGECNNTKIFDDGGTGTFDEVLLYDSTNDIPIFAALISPDTTGFDGSTHDFEMLVPEDGHSGDTNPTLYYFYVELNA